MFKSVTTFKTAGILKLCACLAVFTLAAASAWSQQPGLTHEYSFTTNANDSVGTANGVLMGNATVSGGNLVLDGVNSYMALPAGIVSGYNSITIEMWVMDTGSSGWARLFDFGNNTTVYMFLSLPSGYGNLRGAISIGGGNSEQLLQEPTGVRPPANQECQVVWTYDGPSQTGVLYVNGEPVNTNSSMTLSPASMGSTANNWIGHSQYPNDPYFKGAIDELRIYNAALTPAQVYQDYVQSLPAPIMAQATVKGTNVVVSFNANVGKWYWVQCEDSIMPPDWQDLGPLPVLATNTAMTYVQAGGALLPWRIYRVLQLDGPPPPANLALLATPGTSYISPWQSLPPINTGYNPTSSTDDSQGAYGNWPETTTNWVEYDWSVPISTSRSDVYWWTDGQGIALPSSYSVQYWNGSAFVPVSNPVGLGTLTNQYNTTTFTPVTTTKIRLVIVPSGATSGGISTGILQWKVYDDGTTANFPPTAYAGVDRDVIVTGNTFLSGSTVDDGKIYVNPITTWSVQSGPGQVNVSNVYSANTTGSFTTPGNYVVQMSAYDGEFTNVSTINVTVAPHPPATHLLPNYVSPYTINSPMWNHRLKNTLINWIPHLYAQLNNTNLAQGNIYSFMQASNKLNGYAYTVPNVDPYADAYTLNTVESMCYALMYDAQGDSQILAAQAQFRTNLNYWLPIIRSAQWPDGYIHTYTTLRGYGRWTINTDHEGYVAGYFIEASLAHFLMTGKTDPTMYNAAKQMATAWVNNIGPGKPVPAWFDGHENVEQALIHLGRFMNEFEGPGTGQNFINLSKYLLDCRGTPTANAIEGDGAPYDQSQSPVIQQYEVVGHAVRAEYLYSGIEDAAMETGDINYQSAGLSLWDNFVNKKYYLTGGAGSGATSEGFGNNYALPNGSYCETCAGCGTLFFFQKMNMAYQNAKYADLMENVLYNEVLGSLDDAASNIFYPNPLNSGAARVPWTGVPCCYGNASRTLFQLPTWTYARGSNAIYVNMFIGSTMNVSNVAGTSVQMVQNTSYPWTNTVSITVNPAVSTNFTLYIREPNRTYSALYTPTPAISGITSIQLNGVTITPPVTNGYAMINRTWTAGDTINLVLPMAIQRVTASANITDDIGQVALQYGPLIYNVESVDQSLSPALSSAAPLSLQWNPTLLGGFMTITGNWNNNSTLTAIPNYARLNRGGNSQVWFNAQ